MVFGTTRITMACVPRCLNTLTRNLDSHERLNDRSAEPHCSRESAAILLLPIRAWAIAAVWAGVNISRPALGIDVSFPISSTCGGRPGENTRSDILSDFESISCSTCEKFIVD